MKLRNWKVATFRHATLATLQGAVNDFTSGKAVASGVSGTVNYAAGDVGEREYLWQDYNWDGTAHVIALYYAQG